ncbi:MAG: chemotaxis protein CheB [Thermoanaerobaculia bacterium]
MKNTGRRGQKSARPVSAPTRRQKLKAENATGSFPAAAADTGKDRSGAISPPESGGHLAVVGIGASAGGLEAFTQLLGHLPQDTGMAFVLVQHLDPSRESMLQEILARATGMPVREASSGMKIEADTVYVMPARAGIELTDGMLQLVPRAGHERGMPIDHFFCSLAERYKSRAIGVVLSGSLSDGALGLRAIKAEGGVTFAQDETAKFRDMPRAAIAAGAVDFVCPPETIAGELARMGRHQYLRPSGEPPPTEDEATHREILALLHKTLRVDFSNYRQSTIRRRVARRLVLKKTETLGQYLDLLRERPDELNALYEDILITVTEFFRDPEVFQTLKTQVFPSLLRARPSDAPVRIWVPGCSTGEEVYSLAITLFESISEAALMPGVQIFATDISETAIERARAGVYLENHVVKLSPERRRRFFTKIDAGYQIAKVIRDSCVFARQDVTADPPFSNIDLISCRNLLIYLDQPLQNRVFPLFHYALNPNGFLLLGSAEALGGFKDLFLPVDRGMRIFSKQSGTLRAPMHFTQRPSDLTPAPGDPEPPREAAPLLTPFDLQKEADRVVLGRYAPAGVVVTDQFEVVQFRGRTGRYLEIPPGSASFNLLKMAREGLLAELRAAILKARRSGTRVRRERVRVVQDGAVRGVSLEVVPLKAPGERTARHFVVLFEDGDGKPSGRKGVPVGTVESGRRRKTDRDAILSLEGELTATKEYLQSIIEEQEAATEELKSANEEILSSNEELQSTNEELETSKEELESTNEELSTVNEELGIRNAELATANNDLWNLSAGINVPVVMVDLEGRIRRFTPPAEAVFNLIPTDVGRSVADIKTRLKGIDLAGVIREVLTTITPKEKEVQDENGNWYQLRVRPYRTSENRIEGTTISLLDIDPLKRSLEQVNRARDYAEALVETVQESLIVLDEDLRVRTANHAFYRLFQSAPMQTEGKLLFTIPDWAPHEDALRERVEAVLNQREAGMANFELELDFESVGRKILCLNARRVRLPGESTPFVVLAMEDITERREAERHLRQSEARYRTLFQTAREGIWVLDGRGDILEVNDHLTRMLGYSREELVGHKPWELDLYDDNDAARERFKELRKRGASFDPQLRMKTRSGTFLFVEAVSNVYQADELRVVQCNMRDITDRMRLQEDLRQVQKLESIGRLAGGVAHDFNNILNIISAHAALLARRKHDPAKQGESLEAIEKAVRRGSAVVRQLLTFARRSEISSEQVAVNALLEEVAKMLEETFPKSIDIQLDLDPDLPPILADPNQIHQAVLNLCVNARDAMPQGGTLRMQSTVTTGSELQARLPEALGTTYVSVAISDDGIGMTEETRGRVFEPFFTTKAPGAGDGLGLAVVYGVVNSHSGLIELETAEGQGTRFRLHFPVGTPRTRATQEPREESVRGGNGHEMLLLVEDEESLLQAVSALLESEGYAVLTARDGVEAVEVHRENSGQIAVVIADLGLPRLGGWEAFLKMKELDPSLKCIVASGNLDTPKLAQMHREGVHASLRKPYGASEVLRTIRKVIDAASDRSQKSI